MKICIKLALRTCKIVWAIICIKAIFISIVEVRLCSTKTYCAVYLQPQLAGSRRHGMPVPLWLV